MAMTSEEIASYEDKIGDIEGRINNINSTIKNLQGVIKILSEELDQIKWKAELEAKSYDKN